MILLLLGRKYYQVLVININKKEVCEAKITEYNNKEEQRQYLPQKSINSELKQDLFY